VSTVIAGALGSLERLAAADPTIAPLASLHVLALREADDPTWLEGVPDLGGSRSDDDAPLLHDVTLRVDADRARGLLHQLAAVVDRTREPEDGKLGDRLAGLDPLELVQASATQDVADLGDIAARTGADVAVLAVVAHAASLPLLIACGRRAIDGVHRPSWSRGFCPVCAAWPVLAEVRGLARDLVLRCGRCGSGWPFEHQRCPFCESRAERTQGYFAAERERESRRAVTCDRCHSYLKTVTTLTPSGIPDLLLRDLESLELDVVALEHGYGRPEEPGWSLSLRIESLPGRGHTRWGRWWK
jgi:FdhE protein